MNLFDHEKEKEIYFWRLWCLKKLHLKLNACLDFINVYINYSLFCGSSVVTFLLNFCQSLLWQSKTLESVNFELLNITCPSCLPRTAYTGILVGRFDYTVIIDIFYITLCHLFKYSVLKHYLCYTLIERVQFLPQKLFFYYSSFH